jgi:two-component system chemotaxis response regulator CheB
MKKIRVLVVDDAALIRRLVSDALAEDPQIEVVGGAGNGRVALQMLAQTAPDLVTLDVEMPEMGGIETLRELRKRHPRLPVIMFSVLTERGCVDTLEALSLGASDYVAKPATAGGREAAQQRIREDLIPRIKALCGVRVSPLGTPTPAAAPPRPAPTYPLGAIAKGGDAEVRVVGMLLSTGGPNALSEVLGALPPTFPVPIAIVQHMPQTFTRFLAERLSQQLRVAIVEAGDAKPVVPGTVYIAPGDHNLRLVRRGPHIITALDQGAPLGGHRPSADVLFRSIAELYGSHALGLVMTGGGEDGLQGSEAIVKAGGHVLVQDEATSVIWDMAGRVHRAGLADAALPLAAIGPELLRRTKCAGAPPRATRMAAGA